MLFDHPGRALDLGCGAGRDTRYLVAHGWQVTAVDQEADAIAHLADLPRANLRAAQSSLEDFDYEKEAYDLISAQFSLPFISRSRFDEAFSRIKAAIKPGGVFTGQFFGPHDTWNTPDSDMTFHTQEQVNDLLGDLRIVEASEVDRPGNTATGEMKHWHVFHIIAQKDKKSIDG